MSYVMNKFPNHPPKPFVDHAEGVYIFTEDGKKILDATAGWCSQMVVGYNHPDVIEAMRRQMEKFCHVDHNIWAHREMEELAQLVLSKAPKGLDRVYFAGNSGSEAVEAALKISYQVHHDQGNPNKSWVISRNQSYHGSTLQSIALSDRDTLDFYEPLLPQRRVRISQHHPLKMMNSGESLEQYSRRSANELENKILEVGPNNVSCFLGETIMGQLQGDVTPAPNYWKYIREICDVYDVHLILDEVYCGLGRSGKVYCCEWDNIVPDFICFGKTLGAGYSPLSIVVTKNKMESAIAQGQGRIQHGHTHQGHSLGVAASLAVQRIVQTDKQLQHINDTGDYIKKRLGKNLGDHPFFVDVRGRGLMVSLEYNCSDNPKFGERIFNSVKNDFNILISSKWHRISLSPPFIIKRNEVDRVIDAIVDAFKRNAESFDIV